MRPAHSLALCHPATLELSEPQALGTPPAGIPKYTHTQPRGLHLWPKHRVLHKLAPWSSLQPHRHPDTEVPRAPSLPPDPHPPQGECGVPKPGCSPPSLPQLPYRTHSPAGERSLKICPSPVPLGQEVCGGVSAASPR